jgi:hypothetical protein
VNEEQLARASGLQYPNYRDDTPCQFGVIRRKKHTVTHFLICAISLLENLAFCIENSNLTYQFITERVSLSWREREREETFCGGVVFE